MAVIPFPALSDRTVRWRQTTAEAVNRSTFTGATRIVSLGPPARWMATIELPPLSPAELVTWRGFAAKLRGRTNLFRLIAVDRPQRRVDGLEPVGGRTVPGSPGFSATITNLPQNNATVLRAGQLVTVQFNYGDGDEQLLVLSEDLVSNGASQALANFATPLRKATISPVDAALLNVRMTQPFALMRAVDPMAWETGPDLYAACSLEAEEWF